VLWGPTLARREMQGAALMAHKQGILQGFNGREKATQMTDAVQVRPMAQPGRPQNACHHSGSLIVHSENAERALAHLQEAVNQICRLSTQSEERNAATDRPRNTTLTTRPVPAPSRRWTNGSVDRRTDGSLFYLANARHIPIIN
jgi:hypothetical protein